MVERPEAAVPTAGRDAALQASDWRAQTDRLAPILARTTSGGGDAPPQSQTVLCIEDNDANIELVEQILAERSGVQLLAAKDGNSGVQIARDEHIDLILLDLDLPDRDGADVLHELKSTPVTAEIPVVILSAADAEGEAERLLELGARSYMTKPPGVTALLRAVDGAAASQPDPQRSPA
jgi:CheY-like chemotaxis protein